MVGCVTMHVTNIDGVSEHETCLYSNSIDTNHKQSQHVLY